MTVKAYILTTRVIDGDGKFGLGFIDETGEFIDVWYVAISESLTDKTESQIREMLDIRGYGVWITTPYKNKFWIVTDTREGFHVEDYDAVDFGYVEEQINEKINTKFNEHEEDVSQFIDGLIDRLEE